MERVVVAVSGGATGQQLLERGQLLAGVGGELRAIHVCRSGTLTPLTRLEEQRLLVESLGGSWHCVVADDIATAVSGFARSCAASVVVFGQPRRGRRADPARQCTGAGLDVHVVAIPGSTTVRRRRSAVGALSAPRQLVAVALGLLLLGAGTPVMVALRSHTGQGVEFLVYLLGIVGVTLTGGSRPGLATATLSALAVDWYFVPPLHRLTIHDGTQVFAVVVFAAVALLVSSAVELAARTSREAARAGAEADVLSTLAGDVLRGEGALPALLGRVRESFGAVAVRLVELRDGVWVVEASSGASAPGAEAGVTLALGDRLRLEVEGPVLDAADQRVLLAFAAHAAVLLEQRRIADVERAAKQTAEADRVRTALLAAVSHDLRTPLAAAKTAVNGLLDPAVEWLPAQRHELLQTADGSLDRLTRLVEDLLDMSRLQAGVLPLVISPVAVEDVVARAVDSVREAAGMPVHVPELPAVLADPVLLERVLANLLENAWRHGGAAQPAPSIHVHRRVGWVECSVVDHGPGIPESRHEEAFTPFQRLGDRAEPGVGAGLGLAIARGLTTAMGGRLQPVQTPGGGLTMVVSLAVADNG